MYPIVHRDGEVKDPERWYEISKIERAYLNMARASACSASILVTSLWITWKSIVGLSSSLKPLGSEDLTGSDIFQPGIDQILNTGHLTALSFNYFRSCKGLGETGEKLEKARG